MHQFESSRSSMGLSWSGILSTIFIAILALLLDQCESQMSTPLLGQGISARSRGLVNESVPVYVSIQLKKILAIDERNYDFKGTLFVTQSWHEPRLPLINNFTTSALDARRRERSRAITECLSQGWDPTTGLITNMSTESCSKVQENPISECKKYCKSSADANTGPDGLCCDMLWLPSIHISNLVSTPEDRIAFDDIDFILPDQVVRTTEVHGVFRTPLNFRKYPFDEQSLQVLLHPLDLSFHIVPSAAWRSQDYFFKPSPNPNPNRTATITSSMKDELPGWEVKSVTFLRAQTDKSHEKELRTQEFHPEDVFAPLADSQQASNLTSEVFVVLITIQRVSETVVAQSILPVAFIGLLSFVSFFTAPHQLDIRISTGVTLFLSLTAVQFVFQGILPDASYLTSFHVFILLTYVLILAVVLENLCVAYICSRGDHKERMGGFLSIPREREEKSMQLTPSPDDMEEGSYPANSHQMHSGSSFVQRIYIDKHYGYRLACQVDMLTGIVLFVLYVILSVCIFAVWERKEY